MAVQYNPGQQYMLHCDGSCDGPSQKKLKDLYLVFR